MTTPNDHRATPGMKDLAAFPFVIPDGCGGFQEAECGMSLRDWFAGQLAPLTFAENYGNDWGKSGVEHAPRAAQHAYAWADAMIRARTQGA